MVFECFLCSLTFVLCLGGVFVCFLFGFLGVVLGSFFLFFCLMVFGVVVVFCFMCFSRFLLIICHLIKKRYLLCVWRVFGCFLDVFFSVLLMYCWTGIFCCFVWMI